MSSDPGHVLGPLVRSLLVRDQLERHEIKAVLDLPYQIKNFSRDETVVRALEKLHFSCVLLEGTVARASFTERGRQLTALHVAGDWIDLHGFLLKRLDHSIIALSSCSVALIAHRDLVQITVELPHLARLFWLSTLVDASFHRQQLANIGRRTPVQAMVHLACEIYVRRKVVGQSVNGPFPLPLTQSDLADLLGLSLVHISRTLRDLKQLSFIEWGGGSVIISNFEEAALFAGFDDDYLNLFQQPR